MKLLFHLFGYFPLISFLNLDFIKVFFILCPFHVNYFAFSTSVHKILHHSCISYHQLPAPLTWLVDAAVVHISILRTVKVRYHMEHLCDYSHRLLYTFSEEFEHLGFEVSFEFVDVLHGQAHGFYVVDALYRKHALTQHGFVRVITFGSLRVVGFLDQKQVVDHAVFQPEVTQQPLLGLRLRVNYREDLIMIARLHKSSYSCRNHFKSGDLVSLPLDIRPRFVDKLLEPLPNKR